ncbi:MAG: PorT family protein [Bacteroidetes bacterium]|uniref:PorT family protein n=1 Tax=Candidatus Caccoplasma merdipullorum TaxID=2840718 RepID=A0A9D9E6H8_9BACT|nr:PorT family protein [Candidatus Caccoplasma merdipullorum]
MKAIFKTVILTTVALIMSGASINAQKRKIERTPYVDQKIIHFGFSLGVSTQSLKLVPNGEMNEYGEIWMAQVSSFSPGFNVGLLCDFYLCPYLNLRLVPSFYFGNKTVTFREEFSGEEIKTDVKSNYINVPIELKYSAKRINNYRPYIMIGVAPSFDVSKKKGELLRFKTYDTYLEIGLGCDIYFPFFKFIPELKFCFGLQDILQRKRGDLKDPLDYKYTASIERARSNMVVLSFYFE